MKFTSLTAWRNLLERIPGCPRFDPEPLYREIVDHYAEPHRHYHTLGHIDAMLTLLHELDGGGPELELAIWFHDVIYDPRGKDNEARSARWFEEQLGSRLEPSLTGAVTRLILATDHAHLPDPLPGTAPLLIDLDLAILSAPPEAYDGYAAAIRREYRHVPDLLYRPGRAKVLRHFLGQPAIYRTAEFREREAAARDNLERELARLTS